MRPLIKALAHHIRLRWRPPASQEDLSGVETLIVAYNTMYGQPLGLPTEGLPPGCAITTDRRYLPAAHAVMFHIPSLHWWPRLIKPPGQLWVAWSMECEENYPKLRDPSYMQRFDLTMTYRLNSDVPLPYFDYYGSSANLLHAMRMPPQPKPPGHLATLLISSRMDRSGRLKYASDLMRHMRVHSSGKTLNNYPRLTDPSRRAKLEHITRYKFTLAFENAIGEDYVTEKFFDPLIVGSVPVYLGAPNIDRFAPGDKCFINTADFANPKALADYLNVLDADASAYAEYHAWRTQPYRADFTQLVTDYGAHPFIRLCQRVQARQASHHAA